MRPIINASFETDIDLRAGPVGQSKSISVSMRALMMDRVLHQRLVLYLLYLQAFKTVY